jgi:uncharacterized protein
MKIIVSIKTNSKVEGVEKISEQEYIVRVNALPVEGKANKRIIELLSEYFDLPKSKVSLVSGQKSKKKVFELK